MDGKKVVTNTDTNCFVGHAVLYETLQTLMAISNDQSIWVRSIKIKYI